MTYGNGTNQPPSQWQAAQPSYGPTYGQAPTFNAQAQGYQRQYATSLHGPQWGTPATILQAPPAVSQLPAGLTQYGRQVPAWVWAVLGVMLLAVMAYFTERIGTGASILGFILAMIPLAVILVTVYFIDRWEPEPFRLLAFAFGWGAVIAIGGTLLIVALTDPLLSDPRTLDGYVQRGVIRAPILEEIMKGLGILVIYAIGRRAFDGPVDGIVYGALIGAGFAFTENIQYFAVEYINNGTGSLGELFFLRGVLSPFCHVMFTACTGFMVGLAARSGRPGRVFPYFLMGLIPAMGLHALWNGSATFAGDGWYGLYFALQAPLFAVFVIGTIMIRRQEARLTRERLGEYAVAGWFTPQEVDMLATPPGRAAGLAWARTLNGNRVPLMKSFIRDATALAATRQRAISGRDHLAASEEQILLMRTQATRAQLLAY